MTIVVKMRGMFDLSGPSSNENKTCMISLVLILPLTLGAQLLELASSTRQLLAGQLLD